MRMGASSSRSQPKTHRAALSARSSEAWTPISRRPHTTANCPRTLQQSPLTGVEEWVSSCAESMHQVGASPAPVKKNAISRPPALSRNLEMPQILIPASGSLSTSSSGQVRTAVGSPIGAGALMTSQPHVGADPGAASAAVALLLQRHWHHARSQPARRPQQQSWCGLGLTRLELGLRLPLRLGRCLYGLNAPSSTAVCLRPSQPTRAWCRSEFHVAQPGGNQKDSRDHNRRFGRRVGRAMRAKPPDHGRIPGALRSG